MSIATVGALVMSNEGPVICVFNEAAYTGQHQSIISSLQMEHYGIEVDEKHPSFGGECRLVTPDGFIFPLCFENGLAYLEVRPYTQEEHDTLTHVTMTSAKIWDPRIFDKETDSISSLPILSERYHHKDYDRFGECKRTTSK